MKDHWSPDALHQTTGQLAVWPLLRALLQFRAMTLVYLASAWLMGLYIASLVRLTPWLPGVVGVLCALVAVVLARRGHAWSQDASLLRLLSALLIFFASGIWRYRLAEPALVPGPVAAFNEGATVSLRGVVVNYPAPRDRSTELHVAVSEIRTADSWASLTGLVLVQVPEFAEYHYGDELEFKGTLRTPGGSDAGFYRERLARQGIHSAMVYPSVCVIARNRGNFVLTFLYSVRQRTHWFIASVLPEPQAALLSGILLGSDEGIPRRLMDQFSRAGTAHIIAISGFNIALVSAALIKLLGRFLQRYVALTASVAAIILYTILVGAEPPVLRAAIMGGLAALALIVGRQADALTSLFTSAWLMTLARPFLLWDISFQISFAATLGLVLYGGSLTSAATSMFARVFSLQTAERVVALLSDTLLATLAAQLLVLPILAYYFGGVSPLGLLANVFVLPVQPAIVYLGGATAMLGMLLRPIGILLGWMVWLPLTFTIRITEMIGNRVGDATSPQTWSASSVVLYYALLGIVSLLLTRRLHPIEWARNVTSQPQVRKGILTILVVLLFLVWIGVTSLPRQVLRVSFLDVGQGDAILIQTPSGQRLLIDGGPSPTQLLAALGRRLPFWDRRIDLILSSHAHDDHLRGLLAVTDRYRVRMAISGVSDSPSATSLAWQARLKDQSITSLTVSHPMDVDLGDGVMVQVWPVAQENESWLLVRVTAPAAQFLFSGDLEAEAIEPLVRSGTTLASTVLKVPHHGSAGAVDASLLDALQPQLAIISVGADNRFGHPDPSTLELLENRAIRTLRTDKSGDIEVVVDSQGWQTVTSLSR